MYVMNGIAYAGELVDGIKVESARVVNELSMLVTFSTGETRLFDVSPLLSYPVFAPLGDPKTFSDFSVDHGAITWANGEIDISPERMYSLSYPYERVA